MGLEEFSLKGLSFLSFPFLYMDVAVATGVHDMKPRAEDGRGERQL